MSNQDYAKETRAIYHQQHVRISENDKAMQRFIGMFNNEYFGFKNDWLKGKKILDAGCGDTAKVMIALYRLGAKKLHGIDIGDEFIPVAQSSLERYDVDPGAVVLKSASVLEIPYESDHFDFVVCHGVLVHLNNIDEVKIAFSELARVTKPGGRLYSVYGLIGGLFEDAIIPAVRKYYRDNNDFKKLIDNIAPEDFHRTIDFIMEGLATHSNDHTDLTFLKDLFDVDISVFLQNFIQAPVRLAIDEEFIRRLYFDHDIKDVRRLHRYVKRKNIRKYSAPLHYSVDHPISKILYGSGNLEFIGTKI